MTPADLSTSATASADLSTSAAADPSAADPAAADPAADGDVDRERYALRVNGEVRQVTEAATGDSLLGVLRDELGLTGAKNACEQGRCGSCSVLLDGTLVASCLVLAADAQDAEVVTVEGLSAAGERSRVQQAFLDHGAVQCGFCTPGFVVAATALLADAAEAAADPTEVEVREALSGNVCRCTGYGRIVAAVRAVQAGER